MPNRLSRLASLSFSLGSRPLSTRALAPSNREMLVAVGLVQSGTDDPKLGFLSPLTGGLVVVSGIALVFVGIKKSG